MKRILILSVLCFVLVATAGTTAAVAKAGQSKNNVDVVYNGVVCGKLTVDTSTNTFVFNGKGFTPGTTYYLVYNIPTPGHWPDVDVASGVANNGGNLHLTGAWTHSVSDLQQADFRVTTVHASMTVQFKEYRWDAYYGLWVLVFNVHVSYTDNVYTGSIYLHDPTSIWGPVGNQMSTEFIVYESVFVQPMFATITVWDSTGQKYTTDYVPLVPGPHP